VRQVKGAWSLENATSNRSRDKKACTNLSSTGGRLSRSRPGESSREPYGGSGCGGGGEGPQGKRGQSREFKTLTRRSIGETRKKLSGEDRRASQMLPAQRESSG